MQFSELLLEVEAHVQSFLQVNFNPALLYHNLEHTEYVVAAAKQLANYYQLPEPDNFILLTAAWFHDLGYVESTLNHEETGVKLATLFLQSKNVAEEIIQATGTCIRATALHQPPTNLTEQIIKDADLFHLGTSSFKERNKLLRQEFAATRHQEISKESWRRETILLLQKHQYYTAYCRQHLEARKQQNLQELLQKEVNQATELPEFLKNNNLNTAEPAKTNKMTKKENLERPEKGVETMFRITATNSQRLSDQADTKANILITVNSIIISVLLGTVVRRIENNDYLTIPTLMLLTVSLITIVFSILATRPHISKGVFTRQEIEEQQVNLLFFGNFYRMPFEEYSRGMRHLMEDKNHLYLSLIRDVYSQGVVLGRKYRQLTFAYNVFMFGLIISVIAFFIASKYYAG